VDAPEAGRVRYLDLGFFDGREGAEDDRVLTSKVLAPLAGLRAARSDKRTFGHVFVVGGSRAFPGAVLMTVLAALRSGAGLVTAFVPETVAAAFAARAPEAMWVGWPETPAGGLALEGEHLLRERLDRASVLVLGPGLGRESESLALAASLVQTSTVPVVIDADALQTTVIGGASMPLILTPHAGEFARINGGRELRDFARQTGATVVLKGAVTRVASGGIVHHSFFGGPVLARGGSGDVLAGLIGGLVAQNPTDAPLAAARGVVWQGIAADLLARAHGQVAVQTTQLLDFLPAALRESAYEQ
jgi:ADP-dependent NAD(P)H-hydrate dehydratase / NAD(P)H-hydrate epimerase